MWETRPQRLSPADVYRFAHIGKGRRPTDADLLAIDDATAEAVLTHAIQLDGAVLDRKKRLIGFRDAAAAVRESSRLGEWLQQREYAVQVNRIWAGLTSEEQSHVSAAAAHRRMSCGQMFVHGVLFIIVMQGLAAALGVEDPRKLTNVPIAMLITMLRTAGNRLSVPGQAWVLLEPAVTAEMTGGGLR
jgi:hypothetical protein